MNSFREIQILLVTRAHRQITCCCDVAQTQFMKSPPIVQNPPPTERTWMICSGVTRIALAQTARVTRRKKWRAHHHKNHRRTIASSPEHQSTFSCTVSWYSKEERIWWPGRPIGRDSSLGGGGGAYSRLLERKFFKFFKIVGGGRAAYVINSSRRFGYRSSLSLII